MEIHRAAQTYASKEVYEKVCQENKKCSPWDAGMVYGRRERFLCLIRIRKDSAERGEKAGSCLIRSLRSLHFLICKPEGMSTEYTDEMLEKIPRQNPLFLVSTVMNSCVKVNKHDLGRLLPNLKRNSTDIYVSGKRYFKWYTLNIPVGENHGRQEKRHHTKRIQSLRLHDAGN